MHEGDDGTAAGSVLVQTPVAGEAGDRRWVRRQLRDRRMYTSHLATLYEAYRGQPLDVSFRKLVGPLPADEYSHGIFPYPARLLRQIPRLLLSADQMVGDISCVLDPFAGSGTVLLEAQLLGLRALGVDQNPIAALVSRVKTTLSDLQGLEAVSEDILARAKRSRKRLLPAAFLARWYTTGAASALARLSIQIAEADPLLQDALKLSLVLTARRVAQTDPRIPVPVRAGRNASAAADDVWKAWRLSIASLARRVRSLPDGRPAARVLRADARDGRAWSELRVTEPTLILTSPPYGAAQKYIRSTSLDLGWLGYATDRGTAELERSSVGREHLPAAAVAPVQSNAVDRLSRSLADQLLRVAERAPVRAAIYREYFLDMENVLAHAAASGPVRIALVAGTNSVAGEMLQTHEHLAEMLIARGFDRKLSLRDPIRGRSLLTSRRGGTPSPSEYIDVFEAGL